MTVINEVTFGQPYVDEAEELMPPGQIPADVVKRSMRGYRAPTKPFRVYIAGPMSGYWQYNYPAFHRTAKTFREHGYEVINPAEMDSFFGKPGNVPYTTYLRSAASNVALCDAIYLLPGWEESTGARMELHIALAIGLWVLDSLPQQDHACELKFGYRFEVVDDDAQDDSIHDSLVGRARDLGSRLLNWILVG